MAGRTALDLLKQDEARTLRVAGLRANEKRSTRSDAYALTDPRLGTLLASYGTNNAGVPVNPTTSLQVATVYACTRILAESVAMLPLKLYRKNGKGREEATDHPLFHLMHREPDARRSTSFEWREMLQGHACLRGNAFSRIYRNNFYEVTRLRPLHPDAVEVIEDEMTGEVFYRVSYQSGRVESLTANDILHLHGLSSDGVVGLSPVSVLANPIGGSLAARQHINGTYKNGNRFPGYLATSANLKPKDAGEIADAWDKSRSERGGKPPVLWGGLDWHSVGMNHQEAQIIETLQLDVKDIASAFRIPMVMLAHGEKAATYASVEQFMISFAQQTLQPWLERWEQRLAMQLLTDAEKQAGYYFGFNLTALLRGDSKARAEFYKTMREIRAININEIRAAEEMNDLPDHIGDNVREGFNGQGGGHDGNHAANSNADPVSTKSTQEQDDE